MPEGERDTYAEFLKNTGKYKDIIILIRGWSSVSVNQLKTRTDKIDFLFIDGGIILTKAAKPIGTITHLC